MKKVLTVGVYDLLHIGHVNLFRRARAVGDQLVVAVQESEVVLKYKPEAKLVYTTEERMYMVKAIRYVDEAVAQTTMDKTVAWQNLKFDAIFHGDDWKGTGYYNECEEQLKKLGVDVVFLPHTPGISSTDIVKKIK